MANSVAANEVVANSMGASELRTSTMTYGTSGSIGVGASWVVPAGLFTVTGTTAGAGSASLQVYTGSSWVGSTAVEFGGATLISDGVNVRILNGSGSTATFYYRKMAG